MMRIQEKKGFTLLEVIICVVLMSIVSIPIIDGIINASKLNKTTAEKLNSTLLSQKLAEEIVLKGAEEALKDNAKDDTEKAKITGLHSGQPSEGHFLPGDNVEILAKEYNGMDFQIECEMDNNTTEFDTGGFVQEGYTNYLSFEKNTDGVKVEGHQLDNGIDSITYSPDDKAYTNSSFSIVINGNSYGLFSNGTAQNILQKDTNLTNNEYVNYIVPGTDAIKNIRLINSTGTAVNVKIYNITDPTNVLNVYYSSSQFNINEPNHEIEVKCNDKTVVLRDINSLNVTTSHKENKKTYNLYIKKKVGESSYDYIDINPSTHTKIPRKVTTFK